MRGTQIHLALGKAGCEPVLKIVFKSLVSRTTIAFILLVVSYHFDPFGCLKWVKSVNGYSEKRSRAPVCAHRFFYDNDLINNNQS